jgi:hypothetical protein
MLRTYSKPDPDGLINFEEPDENYSMKSTVNNYVKQIGLSV